MRVGIFGGTFDPVHFGHLNLATEVLEKRALDEIWFSVARLSPFKQEVKTAPVADRENMVKLAIEDVEKFKLIDLEGKREGVSYTVDTLEELTTLYPEIEFRLIISDETAPGFSKWKEPHRIIELAPLIVVSRLNSVLSLKENDQEILEAIKRGWTPIPLMDVSATYVRGRLKKQLFCGHLVPKKVLDYIYKFGLYFSP